MSEITCNHCGKSFDESHNYCPYCLSPTPAQQNANLAKVKRKYFLIFLGLVIFCIVMILWLPRDQ